MRTIEVDLKKAYGTRGGVLEGALLCDLTDDAKMNEGFTRPAVIIVPGGAYWGVSRREGDSVASAFLARGFQTFTLRYLTVTAGIAYPEELTELAASVDYVKTHAKELHVNPEEVFVVGFSAGGHLVANLAVEWQDIEAVTGKKLDCKPTATGLSYPVITTKAGYVDTHENLLNGYSKEEKEQLLKKLNLNEAVSDLTPPSFIWTTAEDPLVPSKNALLYALALADRGISYELHVYPQGGHGLSTGDREVNSLYDMPCLSRISRWIEDCCLYFRLFVTEKF